MIICLELRNSSAVIIVYYHYHYHYHILPLFVKKNEEQLVIRYSLFVCTSFDNFECITFISNKFRWQFDVKVQ